MYNISIVVGWVCYQTTALLYDYNDVGCVARATYLFSNYTMFYVLIVYIFIKFKCTIYTYIICYTYTQYIKNGFVKVVYFHGSDCNQKFTLIINHEKHNFIYRMYSVECGNFDVFHWRTCDVKLCFWNVFAKQWRCLTLWQKLVSVPSCL